MDEKIFLIKRAKRGDAEAFGALSKDIYKQLYKFAYYMLKNAEAAADVVSETVVDAFSSIKKLKKEESFSSWIFQILSNKCKRKMKEYYQKRNEDTEDQLESLTYGDSDGKVDWSQMKEEYFDVKESFLKLEKEERLIVGMHVFFGYKTREIAEILQMNENTVRSKESRAIHKLEKELKGVRQANERIQERHG